MQKVKKKRMDPQPGLQAVQRTPQCKLQHLCLEWGVGGVSPAAVKKGPAVPKASVQGTGMDSGVSQG